MITLLTLSILCVVGVALVSVALLLIGLPFAILFGLLPWFLNLGRRGAAGQGAPGPALPVGEPHSGGGGPAVRRPSQMALLKPYDFLIFSQEALTCLRPGGYNIREEVRDMEANILVVDDEPEIADLVGVYLKSEGFTVFTCGTAAEALACVRRRAWIWPCWM